MTMPSCFFRARENEASEAAAFTGGETSSEEEFDLDDDEPLAAANERAKDARKRGAGGKGNSKKGAAAQRCLPLGSEQLGMSQVRPPPGTWCSEKAVILGSSSTRIEPGPNLVPGPKLGRATQIGPN